MKTSNSSFTRNLLRGLFATALGLAATSAFAQSQVIYSENFGRPDGVTGRVGVVGWTGHYGIAGTKETDATLFGTTGGGPTSPDNINAGDDLGGNPFRTYVNSSGHNGLLWTNEYTIDTSQWTINSLSWTVANGGNDTMRIAVQVGGAWYANNTSFLPPSGLQGSGGTWDTLTFNWSNAASAWRVLTFDGTFAASGTALSLAGEAMLDDLPTGNITAFGIYYSTNGGSNRTSLFQIEATAIPEPSAFAALAGLGVLGLAATRRRR